MNAIDKLLSGSWGSERAPTLPEAGPPGGAVRSYAHAPVSPSLLTGGGNVASQPLNPDGFPPPVKGGETILGGRITLPTWLPKWVVFTGVLVGGAFAANYALRRWGGRRVATNPKGRARRARIVEGGDDDLGLVERARKFRKDFHWGIAGRKVRRAKVAKAPRVATKLGELVNVTYKTKKRGEKAEFFVHEFGEEGGRRPTLAMDIENKKLHIVGGDYDVTADGIKD